MEIKWEMETETGNWKQNWKQKWKCNLLVVLKKIRMLLIIVLGILAPAYDRLFCPAYDRLFCEPSLISRPLPPPMFLYWQTSEVSIVESEATIPGTCVNRARVSRPDK